MYTEQDLIKKIEIDYTKKNVRIIKDKVILLDGKQVGVRDDTRNHSCSFDPGDIKEVKKHLGRADGNLIREIEAMWTPEVVAAHRARVDA